MLLAPFALADTPRPTRSRRDRPATLASASRVPPWLVAWAVLGSLAVACVPALRGGGLLGATVPFWLAAAPLLDIAWLTRRRWIAAVKRRLR